MKDKIDCLNALLEHGVIGYQIRGDNISLLLSNGNSLWIYAELGKNDDIDLKYELFTDDDYREHPRLWGVMRQQEKDNE